MRKISAICCLWVLTAFICVASPVGLEWKLCSSDSKDGAKSEKIEAVVPGCVQFDWARANGLPSYQEGDNEALYSGLEDKFWHYTASVKLQKGKEVPFLILEGVDYAYDLLINGSFLFHHEGMFTPEEVDLSRYAGKQIDIEVIVYPAPKSEKGEIFRGLGLESAESCKPAFSYGWDWCPRYITLGISVGASIVYRPATRVSNVEVAYRLNDDLSNADVNIGFVTSAKATVKAELLSPSGAVVSSGKAQVEGKGAISLSLASPELWWPHNYGAQPVYTLNLKCLDKKGKTSDEYTRKISFRRAEMAYNEGSRHDGAEVTVPATITVNGKRIFAKGSNWVPAEMCVSELDPETIRTLLTYLKECNMNILRLWGGAYLEPDWFYDMCDEMGIMLWQEFPLACAKYSDDDAYLAVLAQESETMIKRLRTHASVVMYCGGNELFFTWFDKWGGMSYQSKALRLLDSQTYTLDPGTPFWFASPQPGVRHGGYFPIEGGYELVSMFYDTNYFAYTEFGCGALSEMDYLKDIVSEEDLAHPFETPIWQARHANFWGNLGVTSQITGVDYSGDLERGAADANEVQGNCYRTVFELARQKWPLTSMAINWCFNEPWKTLGGNGLVNYPTHIRPAYYKVKEALRPTLLSLSFRQLSWNKGDEVTLGAFLLNDSDNTVPGGEALVEVFVGEEKICSGKVSYSETAPRLNSACPETLSFRVPGSPDGRITMKISSAAHSEWNSEYTIYVKQ